MKRAYFDVMTNAVRCVECMPTSTPGAFFVREGETPAEAEKRASTIPATACFMSEPLRPGFSAVECAGCGDTVAVVSRYALEFAALKALAAEGIDAARWHTGGGCTAVGVNLPDGGYFMLTDLDDEGALLVGLYGPDTDDGDDFKDPQPCSHAVPVDVAVDVVVGVLRDQGWERPATGVLRNNTKEG